VSNVAPNVVLRRLVVKEASNVGVGVAANHDNVVKSGELFQLPGKMYGRKASSPLFVPSKHKHLAVCPSECLEHYCMSPICLLKEKHCTRA
jgi:hypothetical protein